MTIITTVITPSLIHDVTVKSVSLRAGVKLTRRILPVDTEYHPDDRSSSLKGIIASADDPDRYVVVAHMIIG